MSKPANISNLVKISLNESFEEALSVWAKASSVAIPLLGVTFSDPLFFEAFTHRSFENENNKINFNYERLEFLGDSILQMWCSHKLFNTSFASEGTLSVMRSAIVNEKTLAQLARLMGVDQVILVGKGEEKEQGYLKDGLLSDVLEAFLGACYLKWQSAEKVYSILDQITDIAKNNGIDLFHSDFSNDFDDKTKLQNLVMKNFQAPPTYKSNEITHADFKYEVKLMIGSKEVLSKKTNSIKETQKFLAQKALEQKLYERQTCY